jgi:hypothetical protein
MILCTKFNAQGLRVIIIIEQVGIVKIYVTSVEVFKKKETQFTTKIMIFRVLPLKC